MKLKPQKEGNFKFVKMVMSHENRQLYLLKNEVSWANLNTRKIIFN